MVYEFFRFGAVLIITAGLIGVFLHFRNLRNRHPSSLWALILGCVFVSGWPAVAIMVVAVLVPDLTLAKQLLSPLVALICSLLGSSLINWLAYGFHWATDN